MFRKMMNLTGDIYGRLTVLEETEPVISNNGNKFRRWLCQCTCGTKKVVRQIHLRSGATVSCGCYHKELLSKRKITGEQNA